MLQICTYALGGIATVATFLLDIAAFTTLATFILDIRLCGLAVKEGVGLKRHESKDENCGDLHFELIKMRNVDKCSKSGSDCRESETMDERVYGLKRIRKSSFLLSSVKESEFGMMS